MAAVARLRGTARPTGPAMPDGLAYLWNIFVELSAARGGSGFGTAALSYREIEAYLRLTRTWLEGWEVKAIRSLDDAFIKIASE